MIVRHFDIESIAIGKAKTQTPLIVDPDRMFPNAITLQGLKLIARRQSKIVKDDRRVQLQQSHSGASLNIGRKSSRLPGQEKTLCFSISKRPDHLATINKMFMAFQEGPEHYPSNLRRSRRRLAKTLAHVGKRAIHM
jgi:hypothetical protein